MRVVLFLTYALYLLIIAILITGIVAKADCNQHIYDDIYKAIAQRAVASIDPKEIKYGLERSNAIHTLRKLCKGQLSTYEKCNTLYPGVKNDKLERYCTKHLPGFTLPGRRREATGNRTQHACMGGGR